MINVLYEDEHILVCEKPAGIATQAGRITDRDMVSEVNNHMRKAGAKASAYLIHRLDKPVRGVLLFAKTKKSAAELNKQLVEGFFNKRYYALVEGELKEKDGTLENFISKEGNKAVIDDRGLEAKLEYKVVEEKNSDTQSNTTSILDIHLLTGRFHQIRCQLSNIGHPIVGDTLYGATIPSTNKKAIGLVAYSLSFNHPVTKKKMEYTIDCDFK